MTENQPFYIPISMRKRLYGRYWYEHNEYLPALEQKDKSIIDERDSPPLTTPLSPPYPSPRGDIYIKELGKWVGQLQGQFAYLQNKVNQLYDKKKKSRF